MRDHDIFLERALLEAGLVSRQKLEQAREYSATHGGDLVDALVAMEVLTGREIALVKADVCETPLVNLADYEPCFQNTSVFSRSVAERFTVFPLFMLDGVLTLAMDDPLNLEAADHVRQVTGCEVDPVLAEREQLLGLIGRVYSLSHAAGGEEARVEIEDDSESEDVSAPVVAAVNQLLGDAVDAKASDIHINPDQHELHVRYRVDGVLIEKQGPPLSMHRGITQRLKVMSHLDLTQTRRPQDGKFRFRHGGHQVDVRVSTVPTVCGENVVMRLLADTREVEDFRELGIPVWMVAELEELIAQPYGMLLVSGPTGSGKTTTLYTALNKLNHPSVNVMTIEDPVEIRLPYVRQIQVNHEIGLTFASALRSVLRQDPDVVLVGEIRDEETALIAMQAALTGHMVLSTVHTNDAVSVVARLRDFGIPPFVMNSALIGVVAQRLVRRVCGHCACEDEVGEMLLRRFGLEPGVKGFVRGKGCSRCHQTGYRGRVGLYELLRFTARIQGLVEEGTSTERLRRAAVEGGMRLMWRDGLEKARLGQTTVEEIAKAVSVSSLEEHEREVRGLSTGGEALRRSA